MAVASKRRLGSGQCGIVALDNGARLYVSYGTVVGIEHDGAAVFTDRRYSVTTSKQISTHLGRAIGHRYERIRAPPRSGCPPTTIGRIARWISESRPWRGSVPRKE
jgi:hypothetical protein